MPTRRAERRIREWLTRLIPMPLPDIPENDRTCTLCYEPFPALEHGGDYPVRVRSAHPNSTCRHVFGRMCIEQHLSSGQGYSRRCPICRDSWFGDAGSWAPESAHEVPGESTVAAAHRQRSRFRTPGETAEDRRMELLFGLEETNEHDRQRFFEALDQTRLRTFSAEANVQAIGRPPRQLANGDNEVSASRDTSQGGRRGSAEEENEEMERRVLQMGLRQTVPAASDAPSLPVPAATAGISGSPRTSPREPERRGTSPVLRRRERLSGDEDDMVLSSAGRITRTIGFLDQLRRTEEVMIDSSDIAERVNSVERAVEALWCSVDDDGRRRRRIRFVRRDS